MEERENNYLGAVLLLHAETYTSEGTHIVALNYLRVFKAERAGGRNAYLHIHKLY